MPRHNKNQYPLPDVYKWYKSRVLSPVDYKTHKLVLDVWGDVIIEYLLLGKDIKLHQGLSLLAVRKRPQKTYIDRKASKEYGKLVRKPNSHSGFFRAYIYWKKRYMRRSNKGWSFRASRKLSRALANVMQGYMGHTRFVQRAKIARNEEFRKLLYNQKVQKL